MGFEYKIVNQQGIYFITFTVVNWVDVFTRNEYRDIVLDSLRYCQNYKGLLIYGWVIMSNHLHLIIAAKEGYNLSNIIRDFKKFTSISILSAIKNNPYESRKEWMLKIFFESGQKNSRNKSYQFWQQTNHPLELNSNQMMDQKIEYLHNNPVKQGFVENPEDYLYSSARDYSAGKGLLELLFIE